MRRHVRLQLRHRLPLILGLGVLLSAGTSYVYNADRHAREVQSEIRAELLLRLHDTSEDLSYYARHHDLDYLHYEIASKASVPDLMMAHLAGADGIVIASTQIDHEGRPADAAVRTALRKAQESGSMLPSIDIQAGGKVIAGYQPLTLEEEPGTRAAPVGMLAIYSDLASPLARHRLESGRQALMFGAIMLVLAVAFWFYLDRLVTGRIARLQARIRELGAGEGEVRADIEGNDELTDLCVAFNRMAAQIEASREELLATNAQLAEGEARWALALAGADLGTWNWDIGTGHVDFNDRQATMLGYTPGEFAPRLETWTDLVHPDDRQRVHQALTDHLEGRTPTYETEHRLRCKDGSWRWVLDRGRVIERDAAGKPLRAAGTHLDITPRKVAEAEHKRLEEYKLRAERLQSAARVTAGVAHGFNNILAAILGYNELMLSRIRPDATDKTTGYLLEIQKAVERGRALVANLLTYTEGARGMRRIVAMDGFLNEVRDFLRERLPVDVELVCRCEAGMPELEIDPVAMRQALYGLALNAGEAMDWRGCVVIDARRAVPIRPVACASCRAPVDGRWLELSVTDGGPGIDPARIDRIFDPFYSTRPDARSVGLGLPVVHGIVHEHGGHILVESARGQGTTIRLLLPAAVAVDAGKG
jgi:PAS domain S-box-containing protein